MLYNVRICGVEDDKAKFKINGEEKQKNRVIIYCVGTAPIDSLVGKGYKSYEFNCKRTNARVFDEYLTSNGKTYSDLINKNFVIDYYYDYKNKVGYINKFYEF